MNIDLKDYLVSADAPISNDLESMWAQQDPIKKFLYYKAINDQNGWSLDADCWPTVMSVEKRLLLKLGLVDESELTQDRGRTIKLNDQDGNMVETDTCFSAFQIIKGFIKRSGADADIRKKYDIPATEDSVTNYKLQKYGFDYVDFVVDSLESRLDEHDDVTRTALARYVGLTHTLGDIILIPCHCNVAKNMFYQENILNLYAALKTGVVQVKNAVLNGDFSWYCEPSDAKRLGFGTALADESIQGFDLTKGCAEVPDSQGSQNEEPRLMTAADLDAISKLVENRNNHLEEYVQSDWFKVS
ncbi:hypothetical protein [Bifidobacterium sp. ESL0764]|uniref:hypothetical protein n=1 Tax=Bifidobacterium sp. ESL0764 TaxID=2983228 RepID=UPI0023F98531|nr:hypothetical protein [Bifidobacterium sp. ESL0764]WEV65586.1 hypothetical protein OZX71_07520 [Bifidobacterium sp. ESL0764]